MNPARVRHARSQRAVESPQCARAVNPPLGCARFNRALGTSGRGCRVSYKMGSSVKVFTGIEYTPDGTMHLLTFQIIRSSLPPSRGLGFERSCPSVRVFVCVAALILRIRLSECNARLVSIFFCIRAAFDHHEQLLRRANGGRCGCGGGRVLGEATT